MTKTETGTTLDAPALTDQELSVAFSGPAVFTNKVYASSTPAGVRLAFCETRLPDGRDLQFRAAVLIGYGDAIALRDLLIKQLAGVELVQLPPASAEKNG